MKPTNPNIQQLIDRYLKGKSTEEENRIVEDWYNQLNEDDGKAAQAWASKNVMLKAKIHQKLKAKDGKIRKLVLFRAAAAIIILIGAAVLLKVKVLKSDTRENLLQYAASQSINLKNLKETRLILNQKDSLDLKGSAKIAYNNNELTVKGDGEQKLQTDESAFSTVAVPYGRRAEIILPDGSKVWLNSGTQMTYPNTFKGDKREVFVTGEAYFEVAHNKEKPFHVYAKNLDVKVLGTSFNVRAYADEQQLKTTLVEGSVALSYGANAANTVRLTPGKMAVYEPNKSINIVNTQVEAHTSWHLGYLYLKNEPLANLLKTIGRYYNTPINLENNNDGGRNFSGRLSLQQDIKDVIEVITLTTGHQAEKTERGWLIKKEEQQ